MQYFGKYDTRFEDEFLTESYLYFNKNDEEISSNEFKKLINNQKLKKKNIVGTIFIYNPFVYPLDFDNKKSLTNQNFDEWNTFVELKIEKEIALFRASIKGYDGKIVQIRNLYNLNIENIDHPELLVKLNEDVEKLNTNQLTMLDKSMNYIDINNLTINGKFIFFAWGNKISKKEFVYLYEYAKSIYEKCVQTQKKIVFLYKRSTQKDYAQKHFQFLHPTENIKYKDRMLHSLKQAFSTQPPQCVYYDDNII